MAKTLHFKYEGQDFILEFTRRSIEVMEKQGFNVADVETKPVTVLPALFKGAFLAHHRSLRDEIIDDIYDKFTNKNELYEKLAVMYAEPIEALLEDPKDGEGNISWESSW